MTLNIKNILFDFDGVILDSMTTRTEGFRRIFEQFPQQEVEQLIDFHLSNGGWSRFVKIRHFFEQIRGEKTTEDQIMEYANAYSVIMRSLLTNKENLIEETLAFIKNNHKNYIFHIVSGSDQNELRFLCKELDIDHYFKSIWGSPTPKNTLVKNLIDNEGYNKNETVLIGDSINDFEASVDNDIAFYGYNNQNLIGKGTYLYNYSLFSG
ncbi:MAG: HAD family hydrolase [Flavobacteriales bacterium]|nr:HAD family hydrolase [Flavobacteriales bacterium]